MKMKFNINEIALKRRINQFINHKKSGYIKESDKRFIIFESGKIKECRFDDKTDPDLVISNFCEMKNGEIELSVDSVKKKNKTLIPYLEDYIILKSNFEYISGNADLEKLLKKIINTLDNDLLDKLDWKFDTFFIAAKKKKIGIFIIKKHIILAVFRKQATLSLIKRKITKLL